MTERRSPRRDGRLTRFAPALAVAVVFAGGSALVFADGGDPTQIHGCVTRDSTAPNLIVVSPDQSCPANTTPVHWPASDGGFSDLPLNLLGASSQEILNLVPPGKAANKKIYKGLGVRAGNTTEVVENFSFVTEGGELGGQATANCPSSHPYRLTGGHTYLKVDIPYQYGPAWIWSEPVADHGWFYQAALLSGGHGELVGEVTLTCAAVKPPKGNVIQKP